MTKKQMEEERDRLAEAESQFCHCGGYICYGCEAETKELVKHAFDAAMELMEEKRVKPLRQAAQAALIYNPDVDHYKIKHSAWPRLSKALAQVEEWE